MKLRPDRTIARASSTASLRGAVSSHAWTDYARGTEGRMADDLHGEGRLRPLGLDARDGYLYVPPGYEVERPAPLAVLLHGAGEDAGHGLAQLREQADRGA